MSKIYNTLVVSFCKELSAVPKEIVSAELVTKSKKDDEGNDTGEKEVSAKYEIEIPKKNGALSKLRFEVKVLEPYLKVNPDMLKDKDYQIEFEGLEISFIDAKKNVYFRAMACSVIEEE